MGKQYPRLEISLLCKSAASLAQCCIMMWRPEGTFSGRLTWISGPEPTGFVLRTTSESSFCQKHKQLDYLEIGTVGKCG